MPTEILIVSAALNLAYAVSALVLLVLTLRALDYLAGFRFREWLHNAETPAYAKALYFGCRIVAGAIIISGIVSLPV